MNKTTHFSSINFLGKGGLFEVRRKRIIGVALCLALLICLGSDCSSTTYAAQSSPKTVTKTIKPIGGAKGCKLWVQDTITFKVQNGKIVSKPQVSSKTSAANKMLGFLVFTEYFRVTKPTITYKKGAKTATIKTYWGVRQGANINNLSKYYGRTCTVTYTIKGNGQVTYKKSKPSGIKFFD